MWLRWTDWCLQKEAAAWLRVITPNGIQTALSRCVVAGELVARLRGCGVVAMDRLVSARDAAARL